ncbi:hypothetical protein WJ58_02870 [Burkholderia ubonensis]|nr:hypothetical protein WJ58_02870 [Burkholderia ubonensis]
MPIRLATRAESIGHGWPPCDAEPADGAPADEIINTSVEPLPDALEKRCVDGGPTLIFVGRGLIQPEHIVTHKVGFRDVARAFEMAERNPAESCKILLDFAGG